MARTKWNIPKVIKQYERALADGLTLAMKFLESEAVATTGGRRGIELKAVDQGRLINSYVVERPEQLRAILFNDTDYYTYVHFGTAEGKPGQTQPRPILTLTLDRNTKNIEKIFDKALSKI